MPDVTAPPVPCPWLPELAAGYLRRFKKVKPLRARGLWGYTLENRGARGRLGIFVGFYLAANPRRGALPRPGLPECAVFAYAGRPGTLLHHKLVREPAGPFRRAYELLTKYTNRRPRFELAETDWRALGRHLPLAALPPGEEEKYSRNFFMETLALLVRSGLPDKLVGLHSPRR